MPAAWILFGLLCLIILGVLFAHRPSLALSAGDTPLSGIQKQMEMARHAEWKAWQSIVWLGLPGTALFPSLALLIFAFIPLGYATTALFLAGFFLSALGMYVLLRTLNLSLTACFFGGLSMLLTNTVLTLVLPGHSNKVYTYPWLIFACAFFLKGLSNNRWRNFVVTGAFLGLAVLSGEVQVAFYTGLWFGVWALLMPWFGRVKSLFRESLAAGSAGRESALAVLLRQAATLVRQLLPQWLNSAGGIFLVAGTAAIVGFQAVGFFTGILTHQTLAVASSQTEANWEFCTQYFFPTEEVLSYLTTVQFFGGPQAYWGRDGAPAPLRLSDDYMGLLPLGFALVGAVVCWRVWQARLFIFMGIGSLFLSFGRDGILFWILYHLPTMKSQRNPHRWSFFVSLAVCVLAAYGVDWLSRRLRNHPTAPPSKNTASLPHAAAWNPVFRGRLEMGLLIAVTCGFLLFFSARLLSHAPEVAARLHYPEEVLRADQQGLCITRTTMLLESLSRTGLFLSLSCGAVGWLLWMQGRPSTADSRWRMYAPWGAIMLVLVLDLGSNGRRYIRFDDWRARYLDNDLVNLLKSDPDHYRVKAIGVQQSPLLNELVSNILPFHKIPVVDPPASSRFPDDYAMFFDYSQNHFMRLDRHLDIFNVKYILSAMPMADPNVKLTPILSGKDLVLYKREDFLPRAWLATSAKVVRNDPSALLWATLHPGLNLRETVVLETPPKEIPEISGYGPPGKSAPSAPAPPKTDSAKPKPGARASGGKPPVVAPAPPSATDRDARIIRYEENRLEIMTDAPKASILVLSEKWDADWKAWIDDRPAEILKANFLMRAVELSPGKHLIRMEYRPPTRDFWISASAVSLFALYGIGCAFRRLIRRVSL